MEKQEQKTTKRGKPWVGKGRHDNDPRDTTAITEATAFYVDNIEACKRLAEARRNSVRYKQEEAKTIQDNIEQYFKTQDEQEQPYTVSGIILSIGCGKDTFYRMRSGDYDYRLFDYININNIPEEYIGQTVSVNNQEILLLPFSEIIQKAMLKLEEQTETRLYNSGRVGDIFTLKAQYGWSDDGNSAKTVNNNLIIADKDTAEKAIKMLESK